MHSPTNQDRKRVVSVLGQEYKTADAGTGKFIVGKFHDYKRVDSNTIISQVQDLQLVLHEIHVEGISLSESFHVAAIIEKLAQSCKEFKNYLKHKGIKCEDLIMRLRIEEDDYVYVKTVRNRSMESKATVVEL